ncbi:MAG: folylpolyglutamate synthase/dihydrofolate synthase family protein [Candidatus Electrothrix scaldis]|nr:MAG: folylpolyglutamate synthase/dihydrofolate synthase family protein [Candidatus Electrothrix sp. GW3-3]
MNYQEAWEFLDQLQFFKIKLGLDSMNQFLERLGNPHRDLQCIHIGGTNGKGSVGATLCSILTAAGYKTGFYTSPHLSSVRERFRIGKHYIGKDDFARLITKIHGALDGQQITYFECTTTLALLWFAEQKVDCAILEVGMGGRLDATNVVTPLLSLVTNVSMDHEQYLGNTLAEVSTEKAGIIKEGIPVVSGVADDDSGKIIRQTCDERKAQLFLFGREFNGSFSQESKKKWQYNGLDGEALVDLPMSLRGNYQIANSSLALAAIQLLRQQGWGVTEGQLRTGLQETFWPGRLEFFRLNKEGKKIDKKDEGWNFLLDGAHNPAGVKALKHALRDFSRNRLILVWGAMSDKDLRVTLSEISPLADIIIFTRPESERSARTSQLKGCVSSAMHQKVICTEAVPAALQQARVLASGQDLICIAGSLYLVGIARQLLLGGLVDDE